MSAKKQSYKIVVLGDVSVGKTSLSIQYVEGQFPQAKATIAAAFHTKSLQLNGSRVDLQIWDTAGQEKFKSLTPMYYRDCAAALIVYDLSKPDTLQVAQYWIGQLKEKESPYAIILVGNKSDKIADLGSAAQAGRMYAEEEKLKYFTASAKTSENVSEIFSYLVSKLPLSASPKVAARQAADDTVVVNNSRASQQSGSPDCAC